MTRKMIIFGIGYVGRAVADTLRMRGWDVVGTCRTTQTQDEFKKIGIRADIFDGQSALSKWEDFSRGATHILVTIPPIQHQDVVHRHHARHLSALKPTWIGYLSTTGVYGDHQGEWVDENSETRPTSDRALARLAAEKAWLETDPSTHIFRLSGIYGPGRNAVDSLYQGSARNISKPGHYFSRIHVTDIVQTLLASINTPHPGRIYNLADDEPSSASDVVEFASQICGLPAPQRIDFSKADLSDMAKEFYDNNKRVKNDRIKTELGVQLEYATYREGLRAILAQRLLNKSS